MPTSQELGQICLDRLKDAKVLYEAHRYDGAYYMSGYVVEMALKKKICETLGWDQYPPKQSGEFLKLFKTHDLEILLQLSGFAKKTLTQFAGWSILVDWNPEKRYSSQQLTSEKTKLMIDTTEKFLLQL